MHKSILMKRLNDDKTKSLSNHSKKKVIKRYDSPGKHSDYIAMYVVWDSKLTSGERNIISDIWANLELFHGVKLILVAEKWKCK